MTRDSISDESRRARSVFCSWRLYPPSSLLSFSHRLSLILPFSSANEGTERSKGDALAPSPSFSSLFSRGRPWRIIHRPESLSHGFVRRAAPYRRHRWWSTFVFEGSLTPSRAPRAVTIEWDGMSAVCSSTGSLRERPRAGRLCPRSTKFRGTTAL